MQESTMKPAVIVFNVPTILTLMRIVMIPIMILVYYLPWEWAHFTAGWIFGLTAITDWVDGYLARRLNQQSAFGAFLDPIADKLMVVSALALIISQPYIHFVTIPAILIIGREIIISALREWMAELGKHAHVKVSYIAKWKTTIQLLAVAFLLGYCDGGTKFLLYTGMIFFYIALILTIWTMWQYLKTAFTVINAE